MIHSAGVGRMLDFGRCLPAARLHDTFYLSQEHPRIIMGLKPLDCIPHPHASPASETGTWRLGMSIDVDADEKTAFSALYCDANLDPNCTAVDSLLVHTAVYSMCTQLHTACNTFNIPHSPDSLECVTT